MRGRAMRVRFGTIIRWETIVESRCLPFPVWSSDNSASLVLKTSQSPSELTLRLKSQHLHGRTTP
eukprot:3100109-Pleurochrysis_carterae.AAC.1